MPSVHVDSPGSSDIENVGGAAFLKRVPLLSPQFLSQMQTWMFMSETVFRGVKVWGETRILKLT